MLKSIIVIAGLFMWVPSAYSVIFEYAYKGDFDNYLSRFNDEVSHDAFDESLFYNIDGCHAVTLQNGSVLVLVVDGSLGSFVYSIINPDETDDPEICGFGNYHGTEGGSFGVITDVAADKWGNIAVSEAFTATVYGQPPNDRVQIFRLIDGEIIWRRSITTLSLSAPEGVCIAEMDDPDSDEDNVLIIADSRNDRIVVSDLEGTLIGTYFQANGDGALDVPLDLEWQPDASQNSEIIYVIDSGKQRFVKLQGPLDNLSFQYDCITPFEHPEPIRMTLDQFGQLYILDSYNARIVKYRDTGVEFEYLTKTSGFGTGSAGLLCYPTGIAMAKGFPHIIVTEQYTDYSGGVLFINDLVITLNSVSKKMIDPNVGETTVISYKLSEYADNYSVEVYDSQEQVVRTLDEQVGPLVSGDHTIIWDGKDDLGQALAEGVYTVRIGGDDPYNVPGAADIFATSPLNVSVEIRPETVMIVGNVQWDGEHTVYRNLHINPEVTLTLLPGTVLNCRENASILVDGTLISNGSAEQPVRIGKFFGYMGPGYIPPDLDYWQGIKIISPNPNESQFNYTIISGAQTGIYILHVDSMPSEVSLSNVTIESCQFGLYCLGAFGVECNALRVFDCETGIYLDNSSSVDFNGSSD